jgi:hypothetical protein
MNKLQSKLLLLTLLLPGFTFAQGKSLKDLARLVAEYLNIALSLIIGLAVVVFVWNVFIYFFTEKDRTEAGKYVLFSVIGFFVILSFWGIVAIFTNTLQLDSRQPGTVPSFVNFNGSGGSTSGGNTVPSVSGATSNPSSGTNGTTNPPSGSGNVFNGPSGSPATGNSNGSGSGSTSNSPSGSPSTGGTQPSESGATGSDPSGN